MVKTDRPQLQPTAQIPTRPLLDGFGWRLPSGIALSHFALRSGFLTSRLWDETAAWGSAPAVRGPRSQAGPTSHRGAKQ